MNPATMQQMAQAATNSYLEIGDLTTSDTSTDAYITFAADDSTDLAISSVATWSDEISVSGDLAVDGDLTVSGQIVTLYDGPPEINLGEVTLSVEGDKLLLNGHEVVTKDSLKGEYEMAHLILSPSFWLAVLIVLFVYNKILAPRLNIKWAARKFYYWIFKPSKKVIKEAEDTIDEAKREFKHAKWEDK
jgi:hypothetical protein